jgi:hypothetical protein
MRWPGRRSVSTRCYTRVMRDAGDLGRVTRRFSASKWELKVAKDFLSWRSAHGTGLERMRTFAEAVAQIVRPGGPRSVPAHEVAGLLPTALTSCDELTFDDRAEAIAYAALHLVDRYGRVTQVLERVIQAGRLPLRHRGVDVLEVGAGPAPALYACRDFYADLSSWPGRRHVVVHPVAAFHALDRGTAWDQFLHDLSEGLMVIRAKSHHEGVLGFSRSNREFAGLDIRKIHHDRVANRAEQIVEEFERAGETISLNAARELALEEPATTPSAYDLVILCNFLTDPEMPVRFRTELHRISRSLTPGGLLIILGGIGEKYATTYARVRTITGSAGLREVGPADPIQANADPSALALVADHVRGNVNAIGRRTNPEAWEEIQRVLRTLSPDLVDTDVPFRLPRFVSLVFVNQHPPTRKLARRPREVPSA